MTCGTCWDIKALEPIIMFSGFYYISKTYIALIYIKLLIHMSIKWIHVMSCICPAGMAKNLTLDITHKLFNQFVSYLLIGTIDFYHFILISLTLTLPLCHKVSAKQNLLASFSCTLLIWSGWNLMWCKSNSSWTVWDYLWVKFFERRKTTAILQTASKTSNIGMHLDVYKQISFKHGMMIDAVIS